MKREARIQGVGREILDALDGGARVWRADWWKDRLMQAGMALPFLKERFLLLLDVSPALHSPAEIKDYLLEILSGPEVPAGLPWLIKPVPGSLLAPLVMGATRWMARRFIAG